MSWWVLQYQAITNHIVDSFFYHVNTHVSTHVIKLRKIVFILLNVPVNIKKNGTKLNPIVTNPHIHERKI